MVAAGWPLPRRSRPPPAPGACRSGRRRSASSGATSALVQPATSGSARSSSRAEQCPQRRTCGTSLLEGRGRVRLRAPTRVNPWRKPRWPASFPGGPSSCSKSHGSRGPGQHRGRSAGPAEPAPSPWDAPATRPRRPRPHLPDGAHPPGGQRRPRDRDPRSRPGRLCPIPAVAAPPRASAGEGARYPRTHLLQVRGREPCRQPQAEHGDRPGILQQAGGRHAARDRDGGRAVGERAVVRGRHVRPRGQGLHGAGQLRPEAVPPDPDGDLRRPGHRQPERRHQLWPGRPRCDPRLAGLAGHGDLRGRRGCGHPRRHEVQHRVRAQPRPAAPDGDRARGARADGDGGRGARRDHRVRRRWFELRGSDVPVRGPQAPRRGRLPGHRRRARGSAVDDAWRLRVRLRGYRSHGADHQDAHARQRVHPTADPRRRPAVPRHGAARVAASRSTA